MQKSHPDPAAFQNSHFKLHQISRKDIVQAASIISNALGFLFELPNESFLPRVI